MRRVPQPKEEEIFLKQNISTKPLLNTVMLRVIIIWYAYTLAFYIRYKILNLLSYKALLYVTRDDSVACRYYLVAAEAGHSGALSNLGVMYERGRGMDKNPRKAFECYQKAAKKGHVLGFYNLALLYETAKGVVKNEKKAFKLFKKAASRGYPEAQIKVSFPSLLFPAPLLLPP